MEDINIIFWINLIVLLGNSTVFLIAHEHARRTFKGDQMIDNQVVNQEQFKQFLIHVFVISIIWVHFKYADDWNENEKERNEKLDFLEFKLACMSLWYISKDTTKCVYS